MSTGKHDEPRDRAGTSRRVILQSGAAAAALAALQTVASAAPSLQRGTISPVASQSETLEGSNLLRSLEAAGLEPKRLDLAKVLGDRRDIDELNGVLHGAAGMRKSGWDDVTVKIVIFKI